MKPSPCKAGDRIETLPHVGVAPGVLVGEARDEKGRRRRGWWRARLQLEGSPKESFVEADLARRDFVVVRASEEDAEDAAAARSAKRRGGAA